MMKWLFGKLSVDETRKDIQLRLKRRLEEARAHKKRAEDNIARLKLELDDAIADNERTIAQSTLIIEDCVRRGNALNGDK